ncbi:alcohol dehydrogenase catalytic domain-containing protein [Arthrobacter sp. I2-34]|uniref:Alcohol dehydrogenase catalytic domain-containing protein n=1 Tax=Arthrobacter hankyongi TaxID=2904801 RepID=A0ABS9L366_9MICC|nr:alcohol dehydrogenase catalytic domain-containing protein [Arthrobacter hankyongi]MCG2621098.1 alcohol dehydrogenase catalytic domain-containing protein [Arthrobacter hankyongi]
MAEGVPGGHFGPTRQVPALARTEVAAGGVGVVEHPLRAPGPADVELTITLCGLCGADIVIYRADPAFDWVRPGTVLGQEAVGVVSATGLLVPDWPAPGTRVVPLAVIGCGRCEACAADRPEDCRWRSSLGLGRHGAAAGRTIVPWRSLLPVPDSLPDTTAVLAEPTSIAWRAASVVGRTGPGDRVAVSTTRAVGLLAALIAQSRGADVVMFGRDGPKHKSRRELAERLGLRATMSLEPDSIDIWIEASGSGKQLATAVDALRPGGRLVLVALYATGAQQPVSTLPGKKLTVLTSYSSNRADYEAALEFLTTVPRLGDELVSVYPMSRAVEALHDAAEGSAADGSALFKAVLQPNP